MAAGRLETLRLASGSLLADVVPSLGGGVARFDLASASGVINVFRPWPGDGSSDPNSLGLYVLAPWSNRISGGGFSFAGSFHPLMPNVTGEPFPLHGDAWQKPWVVVDHHRHHVRLVREADEVGPFRYGAQLDYDLSSAGLSVRLVLDNLAERALPFGAGFHPWFPRTPGTRLQAPAKSVWLEDRQHLPTGQISVASRSDWDFSRPRSLPNGWINNAFTGWNRNATVSWDDRGVALDIRSSPPIDAYILYSPAGDAPFFCFEPVTHTVDAHNLAPGPEAHGLVVLAPGASLIAECQFIVRATLKSEPVQADHP